MFHLLIRGWSSLHRRSRRFHVFGRHLRWRLLEKRQAEPVEQNGDILLRQPVPEDFERLVRCADEVFVPALAHRLERLLRWNAPVHRPEAADPAAFRLEPLDERHLSFAVVRVAGHDLVGEGESVGRKDESDHDLKTAAAFVAAVAVTPEFAFESLRSVDLEVRAREVKEDDVAGRGMRTTESSSVPGARFSGNSFICCGLPFSSKASTVRCHSARWESLSSPR